MSIQSFSPNFKSTKKIEKIATEFSKREKLIHPDVDILLGVFLNVLKIAAEYRWN